MAYIEGEQRGQHSLFPTTLDELISEDHVCRVIEAFVGRLDMAKLSFVRSEPAETGRPGYDPRDLLKLYLYGYLWQIRSSRRLETECQRNVEVMWLLGRLVPDYKSIAEFRRMHREAVAEAGAELVRFARSMGLVRGEWIAIDGSKFQSVSSVDRVREREALKRYLDQLERADEENEVVIDASAVADALEKLKSDPEPEAAFMKIGRQLTPGYNVQTAVDAKHSLIVAHKVTTEANDQRMLLPMAEAAKQAVGSPASLNVIADGGYSNGEQSETCESQGIVPYVPPKRTVNNHGDGKLFDRTAFVYDEATDTFRCPAGQTLWRKQFSKKDRTVTYTPRRKICGPCALKARLHARPTALRFSAPSRGSPSAHAATHHTGGHEAASSDRGASFRRAEVSYLRTPTLFVTWPLRSTDGDQLGDVGLQPETNAECTRCLSSPRCSDDLSKHCSECHTSKKYFGSTHLRDDCSCRFRNTFRWSPLPQQLCRRLS